MNKLLIKTKDNQIIKGTTETMHFLVALNNNIELDNVIAVGFETKGNRIIWDNRKPH